MLTSLLLGALMAAPLQGEAPPQLGSIQGRVVFEGDLPEPLPPLVIEGEVAEGCCHAAEGTLDTTDRRLEIDPKTRGVANVVFTLTVEGVTVEPPSEPVPIDQSGCRFDPHVLIVPQGTRVAFKNSDETSHNIHTYARKNKAVNRSVGQGSELVMLFDRAERVEVRCDIHPWMKCFVVVTRATHWGLSTADGRFEITGVPPGKYKLNWWHETLGKGSSAEFEVLAGQATPLEHPVKAKPPADRRRRGR